MNGQGREIVMEFQETADRIGEKISLQERDVGEYASIKLKGMKVLVKSYSLADWGTLTIMESKGMAGAMKRDSVVINSMKKDVPVFLCQYVSALGKRVLQLDILDIMTDKTAGSYFTQLPAAAQADPGLKEQPMPREWYTDRQMPGSCAKTGSAAALKDLMNRMILSYIDGARQARLCGFTETRAGRVQRLLVELFDHGGFAYDAFRVCMKQEKTEDFYTRILFGAEKE